VVVVVIVVLLLLVGGGLVAIQQPAVRERLNLKSIPAKSAAADDSAAPAPPAPAPAVAVAERPQISFNDEPDVMDVMESPITDDI
jgi:hypothetical protein